MLMLFVAQRPVSSLKHRSVLWRQVFLRECYKKWTHPSLSDGVVMICSTDSFSFLQKLQLNVSAFSLELLPHAPSQSPWLLSCVNTFLPAPVPVQCCSSRPWLRSACSTLQILETTSHQPTSGSGRSLVAATQHSDEATASVSPQGLQQLLPLVPTMFSQRAGKR